VAPPAWATSVASPNPSALEPAAVTIDAQMIPASAKAVRQHALVMFM
jgi:hypothetical protein